MSDRRPSSASSSSSYSPGSGDEEDGNDPAEVNDNDENPHVAPFRFFPKATYGSIEYPSTVSHPSAILRLISQKEIDECFNASGSSQPTLEMRYGGLDVSDTPVRGMRVQSQKLLLKVTRRRRRREDDSENEGRPESPVKGKERAREGAEYGVFTSEIVGPINHTVRFRSMADYHYTPNPEGRTAQLANILRDVDYDGILSWDVGPSEEAYLREMTPPPEGFPFGRPMYHSDLDLQPLPVFSNRKVPLVYNFKNHSSTIKEDYQDPATGEWRQRHVNNRKFITVALQRISHNHAPGDVPKGPHKTVLASIATLDQRIIARFRELLAERPVWIRQALVSRFNREDRRLIRNNKMYFPAVVYTFGAGPYWKTVVRYGYDPCAEFTAYRFQRIYFYMQVNRNARVAKALDSESEEEDGEATTKPRSQWMETQIKLVAEGKRPPVDDTLAAKFNGKILHGDQPDYLVCDITDPLIQQIVDDPNNKVSTCHPQHGWFTPEAFELIKATTKAKFSHVWEKNEAAPDSLCEDLLLDYEKGKQKTAANKKGAKTTGVGTEDEVNMDEDDEEE